MLAAGKGSGDNAGPVSIGHTGSCGYPRYTRGICDVRGLYVLGLPWLWTWGSGRFAGVARDAEHVAERIAARARVPAAG